MRSLTLYLFTALTALPAAAQTQTATGLPDAPSYSSSRDLPPPPERDLDTAALCSASPTICQPAAAPHNEEKVGFWTGRTADDPPLRTNREAFHDKTWMAVQTFWTGAIVYDVELTHQGLAHHKCVEGNTALVEDHPSRGALYRSNLPEYLFGTAFSYIALRLVSKAIIFEFPSYASVRHIQGGSEWLMNCW